MDNNHESNNNNEENEEFKTFDFSEDDENQDNSYPDDSKKDFDNDEDEDDDEPRRSSKGIVIAALIVILILIGAYWFFISSPAVPNEETDQPINNSEEISSSDSESKVEIPTSSLLEVSDQSAGEMVKVSSVSLSADSWVAVHEERNGGLGNILGALWLPAGTHSNQEVELLRATESGTKYFVVIRSDNGDKEFDHEIDLPLKDADGNEILSSFQAQ